MSRSTCGDFDWELCGASSSYNQHSHDKLETRLSLLHSLNSTWICFCWRSTQNILRTIDQHKYEPKKNDTKSNRRVPFSKQLFISPLNKMLFQETTEIATQRKMSDLGETQRKMWEHQLGSSFLGLTNWLLSSWCKCDPVSPTHNY